MREVERLYPELNQRANEIVFGTLRGYYLDSREAIAHDITVDFLLFSRSFGKTYRSIQGGLMPFFSSYVRKKLLGVGVKMHFHDNTFSKKGAEELDKLGVEDGVVDLMEISLVFKDAQTYLIRCFSGKINLGRLFRVCFVAFLQTGSINHVIIRKRLKCTDGQLKFALAKMRKLLRERKDAERT
ncbi:MAG: hypothetical protein KAU24_01635 [Candidatus Aenigmarchaeota archaeon]|nr:hypothetical protein [Candidatus Aenigmarchaeota archaeon]